MRIPSHPVHADPLADHFATIPQHVTVDPVQAPEDTNGLAIEPCETGDTAAVVLVVTVTMLGIAVVAVQLIRLFSDIASGVFL